jgi:hypothetical protein
MKWEKMIGSPSGIGQIIGRRGWLTICADFSAAHDCFSDYALTFRRPTIAFPIICRLR